MVNNVLIIEDDVDLAEMLEDKLTKAGLGVIKAKDGQEGWNLTLSHKPRVVVLDLILPIINGFDYLTMKQKETKVSLIPVIVLSNLGQKSDIDQCLQLGAREFIIKAYFTPDELVSKVQQYL